MLLCTAALLFLVAFTFARKDARGGTTLPLILWFGLAGGLGLRALAYLANTAPSAGLGFDLFAGQAVLQGLNPYAYSAEALLGGGLRVGEAALERSRDLVAGSPQLTQWLTQVTPAETKVNTALLTLPFLALSQVLTPGSPQAWYGILLASDACTLALLFLLLRRLRRPLGWALLFWVNPIWLGGCVVRWVGRCCSGSIRSGCLQSFYRARPWLCSARCCCWQCGRRSLSVQPWLASCSRLPLRLTYGSQRCWRCFFGQQDDGLLRGDGRPMAWLGLS